MLNEDKIRRMTDLALFEKEHSKAIGDAGLYNKEDYAARYAIRGFFGYSIAFVLIVLIFAFCRMDQYLGSMTMEGLAARLRELAILYAAGLLIYLGLVLSAALRSYGRAEEYRGVYLTRLRYLSRRYDFQRRKEQLLREEKRG
jgi:hypothetical protein